MAALMVGAQIGEVSARRAARRPGALRAATCRCRRRTCTRTALRGIDLSVRGGEILGIAGVAGNGQDELFAALSGERLAGARRRRADRRRCGRAAIWLRAAPPAPPSCRRSATATPPYRASRSRTTSSCRAMPPAR